MADEKPTEIPFDKFCDLYIEALEEDRRRIEALLDRYPPGTGVEIPLGEPDQEYFSQLVKRARVPKTS